MEGEVLPSTADSKGMHRFYGRVIDRSTAAPIASASVVPVSEEGPSAAERLTTDAQGLFCFEAEDLNERPLLVEAQGFGQRFLNPTDFAGSPERAAIIELSRCARLVGTIVDGMGVGREGIDVQARVDPLDLYMQEPSDALYDAPPTRELRARCDSQGRFAIDDLPPDVPIDLEASVREQRLRLELGIVLDPGEERRMDWVVGSPCDLTGVALRADGAPAADLGLWLVKVRPGTPARALGREELRWILESTTDETGVFSFRGVPPGAYLLGPTLMGDTLGLGIADLAIPVSIQEGETQKDVRLELAAPVTIRGRVLDPSGDPAEAIEVGARPFGAASWSEGRTASDGTFSLAATPGERYSVVISFPHSLQRVIVDAPAEGVELRLLPEGELRVRVVGSDSAGVPGARVWFKPVDAQDAWGGEMTADGEGRASFAPLEAGSYDIYAWTDDGRVALERGTVREGLDRMEELELRLEPGARLTVRARGRWEGRLLLEALVGDLAIPMGSLRPGWSNRIIVPSGPIRVRLLGRDPPSTVQRELLLAPGEEQEIVLDWAEAEDD